jgi:pyrroloquinoline-quinone synthase
MRKILSETLSSLHLLKHPYYQAWTDGTLPVESLRTYAAQYFHHVQAFPRYLSATHSLCDSAKGRKALLENLNEEEGESAGKVNHPELWARFAEGLGVDRATLESTPAAPATQKLVDTFFRNSRASYARGLGALYAYEHQVPAVAEFKTDALKKHFGVTDARSLMFFDVHRQADVEHTRDLEALMGELSDDEFVEAEQAAKEAAQALWGFLDERSVGLPCEHKATA